MFRRKHSSSHQRGTIKFRCPKCGARLRAPRTLTGHKGRCQRCRAPIRLHSHRAPEGPGTYALRDEPEEERERALEDTGSLPEISQDEDFQQPSQEQPGNDENQSVVTGTSAFRLFRRRAWLESSPACVCTHCGSEGYRTQIDRGNSTVTVVLWALFTIPGLFGLAASAVGFVVNARQEGVPVAESVVFREIECVLLGIACLIYALPGMLYFIATTTTRYEGCPQCEFPHMIPCDTPHGRSLSAWADREVNHQDANDQPAIEPAEARGTADQETAY